MDSVYIECCTPVAGIHGQLCIVHKDVSLPALGVTKPAHADLAPAAQGRVLLALGDYLDPVIASREHTYRLGRGQVTPTLPFYSRTMQLQCARSQSLRQAKQL